MNPYWDPEVMKRATAPLPRWKRLLLWFLPVYTVTDDCCAVHFKKWRGTVYVVAEQHFGPGIRDPRVPQWRRQP